MLTYEEKAYDFYITNGSGDQCFQNGMWGNCGLNCSVFGSKEECFAEMSDKDLIDAYDKGYAEDEILDILERQGKLHLLGDQE